MANDCSLSARHRIVTIFVHVHLHLRLRLRLRQSYYEANKCATRGCDMRKRAVRFAFDQYLVCETYPFLPRGPVCRL